MIAEDTAAAPMQLLLAAEMQDHLLCASNDLDRLQVLPAAACDSLSASFFGASASVEALGAGTDVNDITQHLGRAITARPNPVTQDEMDAGSIELF